MAFTPPSTLVSGGSCSLSGMLCILHLLLPLSLAVLHDSETTGGACNRDWDSTDDQLSVSSNICCDDDLHRKLYRTLDVLNGARANASAIMDGVIAVAPEYNTHIIVTDGILAVGAPGPGPKFCKDRVGSLHAAIMASPVEDAYPAAYSLPQSRKIGCSHEDLKEKIAEISAEFRVPDKHSPSQMVKIIQRGLSDHFNTRFWLALSQSRVGYHSNAPTICETRLGKYNLAVFAFQTIPTRGSRSPTRGESVPVRIRRTTIDDVTKKTTPISKAFVSPSALSTTAAPTEFVVKRQIFGGGAGGGMGRFSGCASDQLAQIMQTVLGPLLTIVRTKIGDIAQRLQSVVQSTTGKSFEVFISKSDLVVASHQMKTNAHCRARIGNMFAMIYETPVLYDITNADMEKRLSNIDFGEPLGGSGFPGQMAFPKFSQLAGGLLNATGASSLFGGGGGGLLGRPGPSGLFG